MKNYTITFLLKYILKIQLTALLFLAAVRIVFIIVNFPEGTPFDIINLLHSMVIGARFDNHGASYIALLPLAVSAVTCFFNNIDPKRLINIFKTYYSILYAIVIFLAVANVRYYSVFGWHINYEALHYLKFIDTTAGMLFEDWQNYPYIVAAIGSCILFVIAIKKITDSARKETIVEIQPTHKKAIINPLMIILAIGLCFIGLRGSFQRYVLRVSFASFCDIPFYNKIGNNAVFNIYETYKQSKNDVDVPIIHNTDLDSSLAFVKNELQIINNDPQKPLNRHIAQKDTAITPNVVMVLMESMTLYNIECQIEGKTLTPFLKELRDKSFYIEHFYSAAIHTNNGICASMYGYEPNFSKPCMNQPADLYTGLPYELKKHGYQTFTFITGDPHYDNMNSFLRDNNIDNIIALADYPKEKIANRFGVRDDYMFEYGISKLNQVKDHPFFAMFLTCSNHSPYSIPDEYSSRFSLIDDQAIAYADDALKYFFENAVNTDWGKNTIFIFVADHGKPRGENIYDMVYNYNRIPIYIYSNLFEGNMKRMDILGGQIDIFPTVMGLLGLDYTNNTLGIDLFKNERRYIHFVSDEHLGCADKEYFYCYNIISQQEFLYKIGSSQNLATINPDKTTEMRQYATSMMKINNTAIKEHWTRP